MRIALACDWFLPRMGGIELHLRDLAQRLAAAAHDVVIVTPAPGPDTVDGVRLLRVAAPRFPTAETLYSASGVRAMRRAVLDWRPDVVHAHVSIVAPAAWAAAAGAVHGRLPTVLTFHSVIPAYGPLLRPLGSLLGTRQWPAVFTAVSRRVATPVRGIAPAGEVALLPNGIDVDAWRVTPAPRAPGRFDLLAVMRLKGKKRPRALVPLMSELRSRLPHLDLRLHIVGDGPERPALERTIARHGLADRMELLGWQPRERVRELLAAADAFVLPSYFESFGLAALEARCAGVPVVAMAGSGVADLVEHGVHGLLARGDAELADHVATLAMDTDLRTRIAATNAATEPDAAWSRVVPLHLDVYRRATSLVR